LLDVRRFGVTVKNEFPELNRFFWQYYGCHRRGVGRVFEESGRMDFQTPQVGGVNEISDKELVNTTKGQGSEGREVHEPKQSISNWPLQSSPIDEFVTL
jgi:hypothetical protein